MLKLVYKTGSLVIYYSKDSLKAYDIILKRNFDKIEEIHKEVSAELERCLKDFEKNVCQAFPDVTDGKGACQKLRKNEMMQFNYDRKK